jgi:uncharacterized UBP type Zn finger protein
VSLLFREIEISLRSHPKLGGLAQLFKLRRRSQIRCPNCGNVFKALEDRTAIDLPLPKADAISSALKVVNLVTNALMPSTVFFDCKKCGENRVPGAATYHVEIWPTILVCHIVRYREDELRHVTNILMNLVDVPELFNTGQISSDSGDNYNYVLYAVVIQQVSAILSQQLEFA